MSDLPSTAAQNSLRPIRLNLADAFSSDGEMALLKGDWDKGIDCFESATNLDPSNHKMLFSQALCLFDFGATHAEDKAFSLAHKKLKNAVELNPDDFELWKVWGSLFCMWGLHSEEIRHFKAAKDKLNKALLLSANQEKSVLAELNWDLGVSYSKLAEHSQEALDWHQAIQAFEVALSHDESPCTDFWIDYGQAQLKLAATLNDVRSFIKAVQSLKKAVSLDPDSFDGYHLLAQTMQKLYLHSHDEDHFSEANEYYSLAATANPLSNDLLFEWAEFLFHSGMARSDIKKLKSCLNKCKRAHEIDPDDFDVQFVWASALSLIGAQLDRLDLIQEAEKKLDAIPEEQFDSTEGLYSEGINLRALATYFNDDDYFYQAIEKFQEALSIDRTCHHIWHAMATTYAILGKSEECEENFKLSLRFFQKALDLSNSTDYLFDYAHALLELAELTQTQECIEEAVKQFERLLQLQRSAFYLHPDWLLQYARALDLLGDFHEEASFYERAIEIFSHLLSLDSDSSAVHHHLSLALSHLGEINAEKELFERALHHYRLALKNQEESEAILIDWATTLINLACHSSNSSESDLFFRDAERKVEKALRLGNETGHYTLACLYSLTDDIDKSLYHLHRAYRAEVIPSLEDLLEDDWLENLRSTSVFQGFLQQITQSQRSPDES